MNVNSGSIVFVGAANPETIRMILAVQTATPNFRVYGFIDNDPDKKGTEFYGYPIFGGVECVPRLVELGIQFVNLITGDLQSRFSVSREIARLGGKFTNFVHPNVNLTMTDIGVGNYIQESVIVQAGVSIGDNASIHMGSLIGHESSIGNSVFLAHAVSVSGCCEIGDGCFIGTNATILPRITIGKWSTIGAGAVVTKSIPDYSVVVGNPGKIIKTNNQVFDGGDIFSE
ncbi:sugar O-acyltransferase, sialic acid O-acetyltransferase NeuD family [Oleiphilus messinensis]|uniref:Sugar O-acyltransferase, sialic acid O-acetyltransferase NeuD family n=1 Tax=Oleiphilus messinensis TaxID=141451 RepID=A0A1Y0I9E3_9GAMM|nr:NeuD/PglB/VioB family sugar acetyltransferase [Oleiphilus messinensis]ARU56013.1 sugar O-acyltransferase, sialic acid O-acetyltransferase NeuD family [Oleiphilus messinensis]